MGSFFNLIVRREIYFVAFLILVVPFAGADESPNKSKRQLPIISPFQRDAAKVETVADTLEYSHDQKKVTATGNVVLSYENYHLTADYAEVETDTKKAYSKGHVIIFKDELPMATGDEIHYNFETHSGDFPDGRLLLSPWFIRGSEMKQIKEGVKVAYNASTTTCDRENPHYAIHAKKVTLYDEDKLVARNVTIRVLGKPVFWWPYLVIPLQQNNFPFAINLGYNSRHGFYDENTKGFSITKQVHGKIHADWRSKRGFGAGGDLDYNFGKLFEGELKLYLTQDERAPATSSEPYVVREERDRGRISLRHKTTFDKHTHITARYNRIADEFFLQDFFEKEHRAELDPSSFVTAIKNGDRAGAMVHVEKKMNGFESTIEHLPQVRLDWKNQPLILPRFFYESQLSYDSLAKRFKRSDYNEDVTRVDQFNEWTYPLKWHEIKLTPIVDFRNTYYSREKESDNNRFRTVFGFATDLRTQFYKTYNVSFSQFGIEANQLRHIFEPVIRYDLIRSTVSDETIHYFDTNDRIDDADIVSFGFENRIQTKRVVAGKMQRVDIVSMNTYLRYEMNPDEQAFSNFTVFEHRIPYTQSSLTLLSQELTLRPYSWLQYETRIDYDLKRDSFRVINQDLLIKIKRFKALFGHRYVKEIENFQGNNQFVFDGDFMINPLWSVGGYIRWDADDLGLEEWQVAATRDLHDFLLDFGYNVRNSAIESSSKELFFNLRMKAFPQLMVRSGNTADFSEPRIGETVAGANQEASVSAWASDPALRT